MTGCGDKLLDYTLNSQLNTLMVRIFQQRHIPKCLTLLPLHQLHFFFTFYLFLLLSVLTHKYVCSSLIFLQSVVSVWILLTVRKRLSAFPFFERAMTD